MSTKQKIHQAKLNDLAIKCAYQIASGLTVREWCTQNNVTIHKYNYWKHLLKEEYADFDLYDIESVPISAMNTAPISATCTNKLTNNNHCAKLAPLTVFIITQLYATL